MRIVSTTLLALALMIAAACGGSNSAPAASGPLTGNWQFNLSQQEPPPATAVSVSGFIQQSGTSVEGSVTVPTDPSGNCGGVVTLTGDANGQNVSLSINQNGTVLNFTGTVDYPNASMSGSYAGQGGSCFNKPTTGTWSAVQIPSISGSFTGNLSNSAYMALLGVTAPIQVSGTLTQSPNAGANASVTGTITATGYPCFSTATLAGTVSGQNVYLAIYSYTGEQIGTLGAVDDAATVSSVSGGIQVMGKLSLEFTTTAGTFGPCPAVNGVTFDEPNACLAISPAVCK